MLRMRVSTTKLKDDKTGNSKRIIRKQRQIFSLHGGEKTIMF
jgi:hypothetical protein